MISRSALGTHDKHRAPPSQTVYSSMMGSSKNAKSSNKFNFNG